MDDIFNETRDAVYEFLLDDYDGEEAFKQVANANIFPAQGGNITVLYDNGKADLIRIIDGVAELVEV